MIFLSPLSYLVPAYATAPALMYVGLLMLGNVTKLDFNDSVDALSGMLCAVFIVLTCNIVTGIMLGFVALVFLPSILREMRLALPSSAGLGRWLSTGYRAIERLVRLWGLAVALGAAAVALLLLMSQFARSGVITYPAAFDAHLQGITDTVEQLSKNWLSSIVIGIAGGYFFNVVVQGGTPGAYLASFGSLAQLPDLYISTVKAAIFGVIAGVVAAYKGLNPKGGPKGVGDAVNQSVVITFLLLFFANLILTAVYLQVVPPKGA